MHVSGLHLRVRRNILVLPHPFSTARLTGFDFRYSMLYSNIPGATSAHVNGKNCHATGIALRILLPFLSNCKQIIMKTSTIKKVWAIIVGLSVAAIIAWNIMQAEQLISSALNK